MSPLSGIESCGHESVLENLFFNIILCDRLCKDVSYILTDSQLNHYISSVNLAIIFTLNHTKLKWYVKGISGPNFKVVPYSQVELLVSKCIYIYMCVTRFDKTRLPHTSNYSTSNSCNFTIRKAINLKILHSLFISS